MRRRVGPVRRNKARWPRFVIAGLVVALALIGGWKLFSLLNEVGVTGLFRFPGAKTRHYVVQLEDQPVYRIKKKQELLGVTVTRIVSRRQPEEFLVMDGVSRKMVNSLFAKPVDLSAANMLANQFLRLRESGEDAAPVTIAIQEVKTLRTGNIRMDGRALPFWEIRVRFKLSNESASRFYEAIIVRGARPDNPADKDTLVVAYAQKEAFSQALLADLLQNLRFEKT